MTISPEKRWEIELNAALCAKYGTSPVRVTVTEHPVMAGYLARVAIPGQYREIYISGKMSVEDVKDGVLFATYLLLDEDEDDGD